ncbi:helix-turn-helix domain-containing protein [Actinomadura geliboluensis]|uniref:helix-turn-helix domain-containing protein n=1 Tax=Actinomadura geliboluensis TaxID=882440 RepID=UPI002627DEF9|nr:helix-turn-helix transcriptional regulator [Actinomadura geliboluensis]
MSTQTSIPDGRFVAFQVRYQLKDQGRTQSWLARQLNQPRDWMSRRVRGEVPFNVEEIQQVADALGVEVACFFPPVQSQARAS